MAFKKIEDGVYEMPAEGSMKVPARVYASDKLFQQLEEGAVNQVKNVAHLPGIQKYSIGMPDIHFGYGFPIGGVAGIDVQEGVVCPGGVGYDISCGVRLIRTNLTLKEVQPKLKELINDLFEQVPSGIGSKGKARVNEKELKEAVEIGAPWAIKKGYGFEQDAERTEEHGSFQGGDFSKLSQKAIKRGLPQFGSLGSGNHFLEIQIVKDVFEEEIAKKFGLFQGQIVIMLHSGSRGFGYQVADDYIKVMLDAMRKYKIEMPDRQLCCAPIESQEGKDYLAAMACATNYAFCNRQFMTHWIREGMKKVLGVQPEELEVVYDICHNVAKFEEHGGKDLLVHRKGATRAMPAGRKENPKIYAETGHPALIPGSMGTPSYVCVGTQKGLEQAFASVCHGAGRRMSRTAALRIKRGDQVQRELEAKGEVVKTGSLKGLAEEMPEAYKDIDEVVKSIELSGIGKKVTRHSPIGVIKG